MDFYDLLGEYSLKEDLLLGSIRKTLKTLSYWPQREVKTTLGWSINFTPDAC